MPAFVNRHHLLQILYIFPEKKTIVFCHQSVGENFSKTFPESISALRSSGGADLTGAGLENAKMIAGDQALAPSV